MFTIFFIDLVVTKKIQKQYLLVKPVLIYQKSWNWLLDPMSKILNGKGTKTIFEEIPSLFCQLFIRFVHILIKDNFHRDDPSEAFQDS